MKKYSQFIDRLALKTPLIQAPMAHVSTPQVAAEVYKAGGLGSLPMSTINLTKDVGPVFDAIELFRKSAGPKAPVNCNFFCYDPAEQHVPTQEEKENWTQLYSSATGVSALEVGLKVTLWPRALVLFAEFERDYPTQCSQFVERLVAVQPGVVLFHFGVPSIETIRKFQAGGVLVLCTATSVAEAKQQIDLGIDGIVCQGYEAGGHRGNYLGDPSLDEKLSTLALFDLVALVVAKSSHQPYLIPTGGIVTGEASAFYLKRGAAAVQLGTVFIPVSESAAPPFLANAIALSSLTPTVVTPLISGRSARTVATPFIRGLVTEQARKMYELPSFGYATAAYKQFSSGQAEYGFFLAGENYHFVPVGKNTSEIMQMLISDVEKVI